MKFDQSRHCCQTGRSLTSTPNTSCTHRTSPFYIKQTAKSEFLHEDRLNRFNSHIRRFVETVHTVDCFCVRARNSSEFALNNCLNNYTFEFKGRTLQNHGFYQPVHVSSRLFFLLLLKFGRSVTPTPNTSRTD